MLANVTVMGVEVRLVANAHFAIPADNGSPAVEVGCDLSIGQDAAGRPVLVLDLDPIAEAVLERKERTS